MSDQTVFDGVSVRNIDWDSCPSATYAKFVNAQLHGGFGNTTKLQVKIPDRAMSRPVTDARKPVSDRPFNIGGKGSFAMKNF